MTAPLRRIRLVPSGVAGVLGLPEFRGPVVLPAGILKVPGLEEWLVPHEATLAGGHEREGRILVLTRAAEEDWSGLLREALTRRPQRECSAAVVFGRGAATGRAAAACRCGDDVKPVDELLILGPGLPVHRLSRLVMPIDEVRRIRDRQPLERERHERWSRTIGALGERPWSRLAEASVAIVGCSRLGSLMAASLVRSGLRHLLLIDPDVVEPHNLGEMDLVTSTDIGTPKVEALAEHLRGLSDVSVETVSLRIDQRAALQAARSRDILISCSDNERARWLCSVLSLAYLRPLLDVGTGVFGTGDNRRLGLDVRLVTASRCLLCAGGVQGGPERPVRAEADAAADEAWQRERAGSLRSLNQVAVGVGQRLLEDLFGGRVRHDVWLTIEFGPDGMPTLRRRTVARVASCSLCAIAGTGDHVLPLLPGLMMTTLGLPRPGN